MPCASVPVLAPAPPAAPRSRAPVRVCVCQCSSAGLLVLLLGYLLLGALLFHLLESKDDSQQVRQAVAKQRQRCLANLWTITERLNVLYERNWTRLVHEQLAQFEASVVQATRAATHAQSHAHAHNNAAELHDAELHWTFGSSLLYSVTLVTTIGYGNLSPKTTEGKLVTMLYAVIGVPLMLICLSNLGSLLAKAFQCLYTYACCLRAPSDSESASSDEEKEKERGKSRSSCDGSLANRNNHPSSTRARSTLVAVGSRCGKPVCRLTPDTEKLTLYNQHVTANASADYSGHDSEDEDPDNARGAQTSHDTPSRVPLIWRDPRTSSSSSSRRAPTPPPPRLLVRRPPKPRVPPSLVLLVLFGYLLLGAAMFASWENWTYLDSAYFCFVTLSTIGFGELVPSRSLKSAENDDNQTKLVVCCAYLLFGLAVVAMSFTLMQDEIAYRSRQLAVYCGLTRRPDTHV